MFGIPSEPQAITSVCLEVEKELTEPWSLDRMAALAGLSPYHFCHEFSRIKKESPVNWLNRLRLEQAALWLKFNARSTTEIADECGYQSREGFSRAFSRKFKMSPRAFRRQARHRLDQLAKKTAVLRAACPVHRVHREAETVLCVRHTGPYHGAVRAFNRLGEWARITAAPLADTCCVGINYDEPGITPVRYRRYDAGVISVNGMPVAPFMHTRELPGGLYACAEYSGNISGLINTWNWFIAVWLRENCHFVNGNMLFDEHPAIPLLSRPINWFDMLRVTIHCRLFIPIADYRKQGTIPIGSCPEKNKKTSQHRKIGHTLKNKFL
jgi:AraC family transcriptional regulator